MADHAAPKNSSRADRIAGAVFVSCLTFAVVATVAQATTTKQRPANAKRDSWADVPSELLADVVNPNKAVHALAKMLPHKPTANHTSAPTAAATPPPVPTATVSAKPQEPASAPTTPPVTQTPAPPAKARHRAPRRTRQGAHGYAPHMGYQVTAQGLTGRTTFTADTLPAVLAFLSSHGLAVDQDSVRRQLAETGDWRGTVGSGPDAMTVHVVVDHHG